MILLKPLQRLRDLDIASPKFQKQLTNCLQGTGSAVSGFQGEDLAWLVEYLDGVSLQTTSPHSPLIDRADPRRYSRSRKCHIPGIVAPTRRHMRRQEGATEILYAFSRFPPGRRPFIRFWIRV